MRKIKPVKKTAAVFLFKPVKSIVSSAPKLSLPVLKQGYYRLCLLGIFRQVGYEHRFGFTGVPMYVHLSSAYRHTAFASRIETSKAAIRGNPDRTITTLQHVVDT